jgi:hypothetical protein
MDANPNAGRARVLHANAAARGEQPMARTRACGQQPPEAIKTAFPHGVVIKVPPRTGFGETLNVLHLTAQQCGAYRTSTARRAGLDEWLRFGFTDPEAAYQFRAEATERAGLRRAARRRMAALSACGTTSAAARSRPARIIDRKLGAGTDSTCWRVRMRGAGQRGIGRHWTLVATSRPTCP